MLDKWGAEGILFIPPILLALASELRLNIWLYIVEHLSMAQAFVNSPNVTIIAFQRWDFLILLLIHQPADDSRSQIEQCQKSSEEPSPVLWN